MKRGEDQIREGVGEGGANMLTPWLLHAERRDPHLSLVKSGPSDLCSGTREWLKSKFSVYDLNPI